MKIITAKQIENTIAALCVKANTELRSDMLALLRAAYAGETNRSARYVLAAIIRNAQIARKERLAICQDTGMPEVFITLGQEVRVSGDLHKAVNAGVKLGYTQGYLRDSIVSDPLHRSKPGFTPAIIYTELTLGSSVKLTVFPKGFGCENKSKLKMFNPTAPLSEIKQFIIETVKNAGSDACPPYVIGLGIGGASDYAMLLAKKALLRKINGARAANPLERELLRDINGLRIGPMGMGGKATCLGINIETFPTHIAGLPVAINISCHALRSASQTL
jgi:fumarate hydratase subunit alpha